MVETNKFEKVYTNAFVKANNSLHRSSIDDTLSGTTGITIFLKGDVLYVANVGDSRAILGTMVDGSLKYAPLSSDQTPFRKDERERLKKKGARIMTLEQIEGNEPMHENWGAETGDEIDEVGDPPRVWDSTLEKPGCAFTRSLGDSVAETIGVDAVPEILTWKLTPSDKFAIVASDGVFEFLTSQAVVDMVKNFENPLDAAKHVVSEAYRLWLTYDDRTDDITIIIVLFDDFKATGVVDTSRNDADAMMRRTMISDAVDSKPVRRVLSKSKRKVISENWNDDDNEEFDFAANATKKTPEELERLSDMVKSNFMFQHLTNAQKEQIFQVMRLKFVTADQTIIKEGDAGDEMYIIDSGEFTVHKKNEEGVSNLIFTYTSAGSAFGELSLMYGKPRAASIKAKTDGKLWCIGRQAFRSVLMKKKQDGLLKLLHGIPILSHLPLPRLQQLCEQTTSEVFSDGHELYNESKGGSPMWILCIILDGAVSLTPKDPKQVQQVREPPSYVAGFELGSSISKATFQGKTKTVFISKTVFMNFVGKEAYEMLESTFATTAKLVKAKRMSIARKNSIFSTPERLVLAKADKSDYVLDNPILLLGDFGYLGSFKSKSNPKKVTSIKVIAKQKTIEARMEHKIMGERTFLAALQGAANNGCLPIVSHSYADAKVLMLVYEDVFTCDLSLALTNGAIPNDAKPFHAACILSAITVLHDNGLMHRFVNPSSIYLTNTGICKLGDFRYAKRMDGSKTFTICGDPLYFAPEIVGQQGYDFSTDLWSFGALMFEIFEGFNPFGTVETDEAQIFQKINNFTPDSLTFASGNKPLMQVVSQLLVRVPTTRLGYANNLDLKGAAMFRGFDFSNIGKRPEHGYPSDLQASVDAAQLINESELDDVKSSAFEGF